MIDIDKMIKDWEKGNLPFGGVELLINRLIEDRNNRIDRALSEAFEDKKKWEPESGESGDATAFKEEYYGDARKCGW